AFARIAAELNYIAGYFPNKGLLQQVKEIHSHLHIGHVRLWWGDLRTDAQFSKYPIQKTLPFRRIPMIPIEGGCDERIVHIPKKVCFE
ncbi:MAG: hypothetical protein ABIQ75_06720, partial [Flavobacteriales bacterium]